MASDQICRKRGLIPHPHSPLTRREEIIEAPTRRDLHPQGAARTNKLRVGDPQEAEGMGKKKRNLCGERGRKEKKGTKVPDLE